MAALTMYEAIPKLDDPSPPKLQAEHRQGLVR